jgi:hypothetical protein
MSYLEDDLRELEVMRWGQKMKNKEEWAKGKGGQGCWAGISKK